MKNKELILSNILIMLSIIILNPFDIWMPNMIHIFIFSTIFVVFGFYTSFVLQEKTLDERDIKHRSDADRFSFLTGSAFILFGIVYESYMYKVNHWLVITLILMMFSKIFYRIWISYKN